MRAHHRCPDLTRDPLAERVVLLRSLHQRAHDVLLRGDAAEEVSLRLGRHLVVEDRRVTRVGHKHGDVGPLRHLAGERRRGIQHDQHSAAGEQMVERRRDLADAVVGHREDHRIRATQRILHGMHGQAASTQRRDPGVADLDMGDVVIRLQQVVGDAAAHLTARTDQRYSSHGSIPIFSYVRWRLAWRDGRSPPRPSARP